LGNPIGNNFDDLKQLNQKTSKNDKKYSLKYFHYLDDEKN
jgi:hypothetical protein